MNASFLLIIDVLIYLIPTPQNFIMNRVYNSYPNVVLGKVREGYYFLDFTF